MTTKAELIAIVARSAGLSKQAARVAVETVVGTLRDSLASSGTASLPDIGKFKVVDRAERTARNPRTGEALTIAARKAVRFRPAADLKRSVQSRD